MGLAVVGALEAPRFDPLAVPREVGLTVAPAVVGRAVRTLLPTLKPKGGKSRIGNAAFPSKLLRLLALKPAGIFNTQMLGLPPRVLVARISKAGGELVWNVQVPPKFSDEYTPWKEDATINLPLVEMDTEVKSDAGIWAMVQVLPLFVEIMRPDKPNGRTGDTRE